MTDKTFDIIKKEDSVKLQIGSDIIGLDDTERMRILKLFIDIKQSDRYFPSGLQGVCIMYENGLIAANISVSKITKEGDKYLLFLYHLTPNSPEYSANTFMLTNVILDKYIESLS